MNLMYKTLVAVACLGITSASSVFAADKNYSLTLSNPGQPAKVEVELHRGELTVIGYDGSTIEIKAEMKDREESEQTKHAKKIQKQVKKSWNKHKQPERSTEGLKAVKNVTVNLEIEEDNNEVEISSMSMNQYVHLTLMVPYNTAVESEVFQGGGIEVKDVSGELELQAYQGGIKAMNVTGPIVAETQTQDVVIELNEFNSETPTSLTSHLGNIDITLGAKVAANINVQTFQGEIFSGLDSEFMAVENVDRRDKSRRQKIVLGGTMQAKVNGGGQDLSLTTYMGNLYIRKAK